MCLISKRKSPHRLKRDMRCWKFLYQKDDGMLVSAVVHKEYELGKLYTEDGEPDVEPDVAPDEQFYGKLAYYVYGGYMHAFTSVRRAKWERELYLDADVYMKLIVCECTIPAGTEVYTDRKNSEICARSLRIDRII